MRVFRVPTVIRYLQRDRLLLVLTVVLSGLVLLPLFLTRVVPITDLGIHVAMATQLTRLLAGDPVVVEHFMLQPHPAPYWALYLLLWGGTALFGPYLGAKVVVAVAVLAQPLGLMRLAGALGRSPRMALWAFALCWDFNQSMGFLAYTTTTGIAFVFVARAIEVIRTPHPSRRWWLETVLLGLLLANSHAHVAGIAAVLVFAVAVSDWPNRKHFVRLFGLAAVPILSLLPWLIFSQRTKTGAEREVANIPDVGIWPNAGLRVERLFDNTVGVVESIPARNVEGLVLLCLLLVPLVYAAIVPGESRRATTRALGMYLAAWILYMAMPELLLKPFHTFFIYERHGSLLLMLGLLIPGGPFVGRRAWLLAPGVVLSGAMAICIAFQFRAYDKEVRPFFQLMDFIKPGSRVTWVQWEHTTPESVLRTTTGLPTYIVSEKGGYTPYLFQTPNLPVVYRDEAHLKFSPWYDPYLFDPVEHTRGYDYFLVQGLPNEEQRELAKKAKIKLPNYRTKTLVSTPHFEVERIARVDRWRLYQVKRIKP